VSHAKPGSAGLLHAELQRAIHVAPIRHCNDTAQVEQSTE
jgi:hypothetical protein